MGLGVFVWLFCGLELVVLFCFFFIKSQIAYPVSKSSLQSWHPHLWLWETKGGCECLKFPQVAFSIVWEAQGAALRDYKEITRKSCLEKLMSHDQELNGGCFAFFYLEKYWRKSSVQRAFCCWTGGVLCKTLWSAILTDKNFRIYLDSQRCCPMIKKKKKQQRVEAIEKLRLQHINTASS